MSNGEGPGKNTRLMGIKDAFWWLPFGTVPETSPAELQKQLNSPRPPQLIDVRTRMEWKESHIHGAPSVPINELKSRLDSLGLDPKRPVVAICRSAHRSIPAVRILKGKGYSNASQLTGGMLAWWDAKLPTDKSN